ncbi:MULTISPECIES: MFS transporter [unclassified Hyphomicrobium]|uniref:MFS transporter n=1 Tax=unclassified Hyphomicrobium TaxID=2619925 RepID=UPI000213DCFE|nr:MULTISPECIES: MFS transporter [unclassified Hyphomicrobium]CCB64519.1 Major facilitator superfamily MFS_1 [Hyphomicrobium sp. MC1]
MSAVTEREFSSRERILSLAAIISTSFGVGISFGVGFPLTALTFELWGQPNWLIGLAGAVPGLAILLVLPIAPRLITKIGPVNAIASGCIIGALGFLALGLFQSPWAWIATRLIMSAGFAVPWLAGETWINSVSKEETRGRVIAVYAIGFFSGYAIGPIFLQVLGLVGPGPFIAGAALTILSGLPIVFGRKLAPDFIHDDAHNIVTAFWSAPGVMISGFIGGFSEVTILSLIPNVALAAGWSQDAALALVTVTTVGGVALQFPLGWLSDKTSRFALTISSVGIFILLALALPLALQNTIAAVVTAFLIGGVILGFYALGLATIGERDGEGDLAAVNAAYIVMYQCGSLVGPIFAGIAMTDHPIQGFVVIVIAVMAIAGALMIRVECKDRRNQRR